MAYSYERNPYRIKHWNKYKCESHDKVNDLIEFYCGVMHGIFHAQESKYETQGQASGIAHEYLSVIGCISEKVEIEKGNENTN